MTLSQPLSTPYGSFILLRLLHNNITINCSKIKLSSFSIRRHSHAVFQRVSVFPRILRAVNTVFRVNTGVKMASVCLYATGADPGICERGSLPFPSSHLPLSLPSPAEVRPLKPARGPGVGERYRLPHAVGSKTNLVHSKAVRKTPWQSFWLF